MPMTRLPEDQFVQCQLRMSMSMTCKSEPSLGDLGADFGKFTVQAVVADIVSILVDVKGHS